MASRSARSRSRSRRVKAPPILYKKTQTVLDRIQRKVDGTFFSYWTSTSGSVCDNDVMALHALLKATGPRDRVLLGLIGRFHCVDSGRWRHFELF